MTKASSSSGSSPTERSELNPIVFVGAPRSGTTAIFEAFTQHPDLAWVSNYSRILPKLLISNLSRRVFDNRYWQIRGKKDQFSEHGILHKLLPRPDESYAFWSAYLGKQFSTSFLLDQRPEPLRAEQLRSAFRKISRYQKRSRITAKLTGPGRIGYLQSVFPEAQFVHIARNGLDVVQSLLNVEFWRLGGGLKSPWWSGGLTDADIAKWEDSDRDAGVLAALQWRCIVQNTRKEAELLSSGQFVEFRYEDYCADPIGSVKEMWRLARLPDHQSSLPEIRSSQRSLGWSNEYVDLLVGCMEPTFSELGYTPP